MNPDERRPVAAKSNLADVAALLIYTLVEEAAHGASRAAALAVAAVLASASRSSVWPMTTVCRLDLPGAQAASADGNSLGRVVVPTMDPSRTARARRLNSRWGARRGLCAPDGTLAAESVSRGYHATSARFRAPQQRFTRLSPRDSAGSVCRPYPFPGAAKGPSCRDPLGGRNRKRLSVRRRGASGDFSASCGAKFI